MFHHWSDEITYAFNKVGQSFNYVSNIGKGVYTSVIDFKDKTVTAFDNLMQSLLSLIKEYTPNFLLPESMQTSDTPEQTEQKKIIADKIITPSAEKVITKDEILGGSFGNTSFIKPPTVTEIASQQTIQSVNVNLAN